MSILFKTMPDFETALSSGKIHENLICKKIKTKYPKAFVEKGYCSGFDIFVPEQNIRVEVKQDFKSNHTNNYVVEVEFNGEPSALTASVADYWVFCDGQTDVWISPDALKRIVKNMKVAEFIAKGDKVSKKAYLVPKRIIKDNACLINE